MALKDTVLRMKSDYPFYAANCLKIKTKGTETVPFTLNKAQWYLHSKLEKQKKELGMVRALIVKGRQQGCSTYVSGRFFHKAHMDTNTSVFILSHEAKSTENLYSMSSRYLENLPEQIQPDMLVHSTKQMRFKNGSEYRVGTAGSKSTGRSLTINLFHGSEVAFYENTDDLQTGVLQTVADLPGTEIILESTANGNTGFFYEMVQSALNGESLYQVVFIPWYWQPEYTADLRPDFKRTEEENELVKLYGLTDGQLQWRRYKVAAFKSQGHSEWMFKQEYPNTLQEAFQSSGSALIQAEHVYRAVKNTKADTNAPRILGVDPARSNDRTVITCRRGREIEWFDAYNKMDEMTLAGILGSHIKKYNIEKVFIDAGGGHGTVDRMWELGFRKEVVPVYFGSKPMDQGTYVNKRAEMAGLFRQWLEDEHINMPHNEAAISDILAIPDFDTNSNSLLILPKKDKIKQDIGRSPDYFDSIILTFAYPVRNPNIEAIRQNVHGTRKKSSSLSTVQRLPGRSRVNPRRSGGHQPQPSSTNIKFKSPWE